jgi:hypothetical protein
MNTTSSGQEREGAQPALVDAGGRFPIGRSFSFIFLGGDGSRRSPKENTNREPRKRSGFPWGEVVSSNQAMSRDIFHRLKNLMPSATEMKPCAFPEPSRARSNRCAPKGRRWSAPRTPNAFGGTAFGVQRSRSGGVGLGLGRACPEHGDPRRLSGRAPIEQPAGGGILQRHPRHQGTEGNRAFVRLWAARKSLNFGDFRRFSANFGVSGKKIRA